MVAPTQDWSGDPTTEPATSTGNGDAAIPAYRIGIYGWRKRCLYMLVTILAAMVIINIALTIWIIRVLDFSISGMGPLRLLQDGIRLEGQSHFLQTIYAAQIQSRKDQALKIESSRNITFNARNRDGQITNRLILGEHSFISYGEKFTIKNRKGDILLHADDKGMTIAAQNLKVTGSGGIRFDGSVQTPSVTAEPFQQLKLESPTRTLNIKAPEGVGIESRAGDISASCLKDLKLQSKEGSISLDSESIELRNLKTVIPVRKHEAKVQEKISSVKIWQLCVCKNGRLIAAHPAADCRVDNSYCKFKTLI